jgi:transposase
MMVVNAHHMRNLPGRKSDVKDAEWIATLMRHGMLEPSFVPDRLVRDMREFSRLRRNIVKEKCRHSNHLEKFLQTHGFKLSSVLSDILCVSGRNLLNTLAQNGTLTTDDVFTAVRGKTKFSKEEIAIAVCGSVNPAEQKLLKLLLKRIDEDNANLKEVEQAMEEMFAPYAKEVDIIDSIPGIDKITAMTVLSEISVTPKNSFPTAGHMTKWAGLVPRNDESAKTVKSKKILPGNQYIKTILCQAAWSAVRVRNSSFAKWFWSHQGHKGQKKAIIAVARKLLEMIYILLEKEQYYDPLYPPRIQR